ncbi:DUF1844 domain-containing protein [bacterium]|nr:DUF1844 domain-containing protein [bacterium]
MADNERPNEDETYTKVDKRAVHEEAGQSEAPAQEAAAEEAPPAASQEQPPAAEPTGEQPQTLAEIGVNGILRFSTTLLVEQAWIALGIHAAPGKETATNLPEARLAIDVLGYLIDKLGPDLDVSEKREMEALLTNLRMNFVRIAG